MTDPEHITLAAVDHVASRLCRRMTFGFYDEDDIRQDIFLLAVDARRKFVPDQAGGQDELTQFKNFLYIHCRNKLANRYRDEFHRDDARCRECARGEFCRPGGCESFRDWRSRNASKACLFAAARGDGPAHRDPGAGDERSGRPDPAAPADPPRQELLARLQDRLPPGDRGDLLRLLSGGRFPKGRRAKLLQKLRKLVRDAGGDNGP